MNIFGGNEEYFFGVLEIPDIIIIIFFFGGGGGVGAFRWRADSGPRLDSGWDYSRSYIK